jgi:DEAD/DEAH box helicase domain-containing protein
MRMADPEVRQRIRDGMKAASVETIELPVLPAAWVEARPTVRKRFLAELTPADALPIYAPGSEVALLHQGVLVDRILVEPKLMPMGDSVMLMYKYESGNRGTAWIPHDQIQATGQDWHYAFWNPETGQIRDADTTDGAF